MCQVVFGLQAEFTRLGGDDGRAWHRTGAHNDSAVGAAVRSGIREARWSRYARTVGGSWRCDETYIKVNGRWTYLYRAVDKQGRTVDFRLSERRDVAAAKAFFRQAMKHNGTPRIITLDAYAASHRAVRN